MRRVMSIRNTNSGSDNVTEEMIYRVSMIEARTMKFDQTFAQTWAVLYQYMSLEFPMEPTIELETSHV